jgi:hypothetical protein
VVATSDVISIRARKKGERIGYSVCDEYETKFESVPIQCETVELGSK